MIFIPTCSEDFTTNLLAPHLEREAEVFRFDIDRFRDYSWDFSPSGFSVKGPDGLEISERNLSCFYLRKPIFFEDIEIPKEGVLENWCREETLNCFQDLYSQCAAAGLCALVHPGNGRWLKPRQMRIAAKYFAVPEWHLIQGGARLPRFPGEWVVKTLTQTKIGAGKYLFVRKADLEKLAPGYPWFIQRALEGGVDETAAFVDGRIFAYASRPREEGGPIDSRRSIIETRERWSHVEYSHEEENAIRGFMAEAGLSFGRFDFIRKDGVLYFLELNPNGQWAWLDEKNEHGLISAVAEAVLAVERRGRTLAGSRQ